MTPCADYRCPECDAVEEHVASELPPTIPCLRCGDEAVRVWTTPSIGRVPGAGGSPSR